MSADDVCRRHAHVDDMCGRCADDMHVMPGVVLHKIGQLRQVFAWVPVWMSSARRLEACMSSARGNSSA